MGLAPSFGLGLARGLPDEQVWVFDGDGGLSVNLSTLLTEASQEPPNMVHFLLSNRVYQMLRATPWATPPAPTTWPWRAAPGSSAPTASTTSPCFSARSPAILAADQFAFVVLEVEAEQRPVPQIPWEGPEIKYRFGRHIEQQRARPSSAPPGY